MKRLPQRRPCQFLMVASFPLTTPNQSLSQSQSVPFLFYYFFIFSCRPLFDPAEIIHRFQAWMASFQMAFKLHFDGADGDEFFTVAWYSSASKMTFVPLIFFLFLTPVEICIVLPEIPECLLLLGT